MPSERIQRQIDRLLDEAEEAFSRFDWETVGKCAEAVQSLDPDNEDARTFLEAAERNLQGGTAAEAVEDTSATSMPAEKPQSESTPSSFADGRYQVQRFLGEGGKKKVYLAHDELLDRDVAFALIKTEGLDEVSRTRISREAQSMGRLGSHPHIVTVFDLGEHPSAVSGTQPYMVTELMGGGDVEGIIEAAPEHKLPLEQAISIAVETCRGLDFAHSKGIVHRDLKPGNIWLTSDGVAKIGDFGLAVAIDRSRLTQQGMMVGTVSYMPPEQAMGGETTPKADLYSLGAMLHEMVTGRLPFLGDDSVAIIGQHINTPPVAPTWHRSDCPRPLEALILRLLAKDPNERPEGASDVLTALESIDLAPSADASTSTTEGEHNVLDSLAGGVFVGRQAEMGQLKAALEDSLSGRGRMVMLVGEPGIGKTRTAQELATYAGLRGCQVLWGRCHESRGAPPYWPWIQVIRSYARENEPEQISAEMGSGAADIAEIVSDVRERLPGLQPATKLEDPEQARFRLFDSITAFLKSASSSKPMVVILDNLHWADKPTLLLLEFLAPELANSRLMIIGTYRDVDLSRQHPLSETLGELTRERLFERVLLRGLSRQDVDRFIEMVSGVAPPRGLVQAVYTQTEGNPLFVTEVVRLLVQEGELTTERTSVTDSWELRIPEGVREVIGRRLNRLSERCNQTLTIAAVIGREFEMQQLARLVDDHSEDSGQRMSEDRLLEVLEEGLAARVIEEMPDRLGVYQFTHALIQQTLFNELTTTRRVRLHARIIDVFEELYAASIEAHAVDLAYHSGEAEAMIGSDKLVQYSIRAGERSLATYAWEEAQSHFEKALAILKSRPMKIENARTLSGWGRARVATMTRDGNILEVVDALIRAFEYYDESGHVDEALEIAELSHNTTLVRLLKNEVQRALDMVSPGSPQEGRLKSNFGLALAQDADSSGPYQRMFDDALKIAKETGDKSLEMMTLANNANAQGFYSYWQDCLDKGTEAIELSKEVSNPIVQMRALRWVSFASLALGDLKNSKMHAADMSILAERLHDLRWSNFAAQNNTCIASAIGDWSGAEQIIDRTLEASPFETTALMYKILVAFQTGDIVGVRGDLEQLIEAFNSAKDVSRSVYSVISVVIPMIASLIDVSHYSGIATDSAEHVLSSQLIAPTYKLLANIGVALNAIRLDAIEDATELYSNLAPMSGFFEPMILTCFDRILGLLAQIMGNLNASATHFEDALAFCRKAGYRPELAWSLCDYADLLLERKGEGDKDKAVAMLAESLAISTELGMRPLMERVLSRREILKA